MREVISLVVMKGKKAFKERKQWVQRNIGQTCELFYNPVQPECRLNERKEQKIKWGNRLRILASRVLT